MVGGRWSARLPLPTMPPDGRLWSVGRLDPGRVRGAMMIGLLAAVQGIYRSQEVVILVAVISGICFGMAFRKGFKTPVSVS